MTLKNKHVKFEDDLESSEANKEIKNFKNSKERENRKRKFEDGNLQDKNINPGENEKPDWKKIKHEKKELKLKRKQNAGKVNEIYDLGMKTKKIWEELRRDDCKGEKKSALCKELHNLVKGKAITLIYAHDTVRVIETLLTAGGEEYRTHLFTELKEEILNLCKNKYSRFFAIKLLRHGTRVQRDTIINAMIGHVVEFMRHKIACEVLELAYNDYANAKQRSSMIQEFFGSRFKYFKEDISTLQMALEKYPDKKEDILQAVNKALEPIIHKGVFTNTLIHTLLKEFLYVCGEAEKKAIIENLREGLLPILHTRDGARVAMMCLWNGSSKDRKVILKAFKGNFIKMAKEEHGHMVILAALDCVDDTVLISKIVLSELMESIDELVENESGRKVLKYLVAPRAKLFFHPHVLSVLQEGDSNPYSKKDKSVIYKELQKAVSKPILDCMRNNINEWAKDSQWTLFIGAALNSLADESIVSVFEGIAEICAEPFIPGEDTHFLEISYIAKMVSYIIQCDKERFSNEIPIFGPFLLEAAETEMRGWVLTNRGCFILVKLLETEVPDVVAKVSQICAPVKSRLSKSDFPGAKILLKKLK